MSDQIIVWNGMDLLAAAFAVVVLIIAAGATLWDRIEKRRNASHDDYLTRKRNR